MIVGVIGSGAIGPDLAYGFVSALARTEGARVYLHDIQQEALDAGVARIQGYVQKGLVRGKLDARTANLIKEKLVPTLTLGDLADCDYVLEAATEHLPIKKAILKGLEAVVRPDCLVGFATSGLPRKTIAAEATHPQRCFVNHPFYPAWRALPIEVVGSSDAALTAQMVATLERLGKVPVLTADVECFAADDIFCNYCSEAARIAEEGLATPAQVDAIVHGAIGGGGPFNVLDLTRGNLLTAHCQHLMEASELVGSPWFAPPAILTERGNAAWHDRKNPGDPTHDEALGQAVLDRILAVLIGRTVHVVETGVCTATETNWMTRTALGFTNGILEVAHTLGVTRVQELCSTYAEANPGFPIPKSIQQGKLPPLSANLTLTRDGELAVLSIFRPEAKNALNRATMLELDCKLAGLAADDSVKGIVLTGWGGSLAGADVTELAGLESFDDGRDIALRGQAVLNRLSASAKPIVAALDGPVLGGGAELSMACHARVVGKNLIMGQPEVKLGIIPGYGGSQRLPRLVGLERALDLLRTGRSVGAADACAWGWATGEPQADPVAAAKALLRQHLAGALSLSSVDPAAMELPATLPPAAIGKASITIDSILVDVLRRGLVLPLDQGLALEAEGVARCTQTIDFDIGMKNFIQNGPRVPAEFLHE